MSYLIYDTETLLIIKQGKTYYDTEPAAKAARTRLANRRKVADINKTAVMETTKYNELVSPKKMVHNLMSGKAMAIDANAPLCCDPSSETYWSM